MDKGVKWFRVTVGGRPLIVTGDWVNGQRAEPVDFEPGRQLAELARCLLPRAGSSSTAPSRTSSR